jgi:hypothetical protein
MVSYVASMVKGRGLLSSKQQGILKALKACPSPEVGAAHLQYMQQSCSLSSLRLCWSEPSAGKALALKAGPLLHFCSGRQAGKQGTGRPMLLLHIQGRAFLGGAGQIRMEVSSQYALHPLNFLSNTRSLPPLRQI